MILIEPGPYKTAFADNVRQSAHIPKYDIVREASARDPDEGDPTTTRHAILQVVDAVSPPLRLLLGRSFQGVEAEHL